MINAVPLLNAVQAADRLGVKLPTIYAYVSRGHLHSHSEPGSRWSFFDAAEIERLARRGRPRRTTRPPALDFTIETELTTIDDNGQSYRGRSALLSARTQAFEEVAEWLWAGHDVADGTTPWTSVPIEVPDVSAARDRLRVAVVLAGAADPGRSDPEPAAIQDRARALIATMTDAVSARRDGRAARLRLPGRSAPLRATIAGRLWGALTPQRATPESVAALNAALVLLADHELASSTLAARVAASTRADPYAVVLAGLGPLAGPLHGGASQRAFELLGQAVDRGPEGAVGRALDGQRRVPGFGHRVYAGGDPRAVLLTELVRNAYPAHRMLNLADRVVAATRRRAGVEPNIDFALAVFAWVAGMPADAGETIFTIARTAGWIAHAIEEQSEAPVRFRARAVPRPPERAG